MATEITMPKLGLTMEEGTINSWLVKEGGLVEMGKPFLSIETDKVTPASGTIIKILVEEGSTVPISTVIGYIGEPGETIPDEKKQDKPKDDIVIKLAKPADKKIPIAKSEGNKRVSISPLARKLSVKNNIDYSSIVGTGPNGRIVEEDVRGIIKGKQDESFDIPFDLEKQSSAKRLTAQRMSESFQNAPHENMKILREKMIEKGKRDKPLRVTYTDFLIKALAETLIAHPYLNASWSSDGIRLYHVANIGFAVATLQGLVVAVIKDAKSKSIIDIANERNTLVEKAKSSILRLEDVGGGTFTLTNLGMYGIDEFSPILNPPQSGVLAVGAIVKKPVAENNNIVLRNMMNVTLAVDHRVVDGAQAADFLMFFADLISKNIKQLL
jgi:pyruvate dehydrogenase E2 component (dihydrolipoamide acetyltransferase)